MSSAPLPPEALFTPCDPASLPFDTTAELAEAGMTVGQDRAVESIRFAIGMRHRGFNLFALGPEGTGRRSLIMQFLGQAAAAQPVPDDWVYVTDFAEPHKPRALRLPPGRAAALKKDMEWLVDELCSALPAAFESEDYRSRRHALESELRDRQEDAFDAVGDEAEERSVVMTRTPNGLTLTPLRNGEEMSAEEFKDLPEEEQLAFQTIMEELQDKLEATIKQIPQWERETRAKVRELDQEVASFAISHLMEEMTARWQDLPQVLAYLERVAADVQDNVGDFLDDEDYAPEDGDGEDDDAPRRRAKPPKPPRVTRREKAEGELRRYKINVLVNNAETEGAPVVHEDHPTQPNVLGRIEHIAQFGALVTDFNLIKPGALHRANGGYLVLDARKLLLHPFAWEDLKRALKTRQLRIESPGQSTGMLSTMSLEPEPIPLDVKVMLFGDSALYYLLSENDPEFGELFKVSADFDWRMERTFENSLGIAQSIASLCRKEELRPLDRAAVARVIEQASREVEDSAKLSTHMASLADLVREADYWAGQAGAAVVEARHIQQAIEASIYRQDRVREHVLEEIRRGTVHVDTEGAEVGQINGLAVLELGRFAFGRPSRVSCRVRMGKGEVVDIEREVDLGGPLHGKGVLILTSFLAARYAEDQPLSLDASLVFEQSYGGIEGDSASSTELYALLSALADLPIRQGLAVTGSVDQFGRVQAIGGVNEKIEGFFDLCRSRGLTGDQGVIIPAANVPHLMLRQDVVDACRRGMFAVHAVESIDQGMELLTGLPAGQKDERGEWPTGTVNRKVAARLAAFARKAEDMGRPKPPYMPLPGKVSGP